MSETPDSVGAYVGASIKAAIEPAIKAVAAEIGGDSKNITIIPIVPVVVVTINGCSFVKPKQSLENG